MTQTQQQDNQNKSSQAQVSHIQLLRDALERGMQHPNGVWVNANCAMPPKFYDRQMKISGYGILMLGIFSQLRECSTNTFISYADAKEKKMRFGDYGRGIQVPYLRPNGYRNRLTSQLITDAEYKSMSREEAAAFRPHFERTLRMVYNMDQTDLRKSNPEAYQALIKADGPETKRGIDLLERECDVLQDYDDHCDLYDHFIVKMKPTVNERTNYDPQKDIISMAPLDAYFSTDEFLQDGYRAIAAATAHPCRLDRTTTGSENNILYEKLLQECISAMCMLQLGRSGGIAAENIRLVPKWIEMLKQNPRMINNLERDTNVANELFLKAQAGEKCFRDLSQMPNDKDMPVEEMLALKQILAHGGMVFEPKNLHKGRGYDEMIERYGLKEYRAEIEQYQEILRDNETLFEKKQISEDTYIKAKSDLYKEMSKVGAEVSDHIMEIIPRPWDYYGQRYISNEICRLLQGEREELTVVKDPVTRIFDVLMPTGARSGKVVETPDGQKTPVWLDEYEKFEQKELDGATITSADPEWINKEGVAKYFKEEEDAAVVRFFEGNGALGYYPPNNWFVGKEMAAYKIVWPNRPKKMFNYDIQKVVRDTCNMDFESISVIKDENGRWVMNLQAKTGENFSLYPTQQDLNTFFNRCRDHTPESLELKRQLAQKYYNIALEEPRLNVDIFYKVPEGIDPGCIAKVFIFRDPQTGDNMIKPQIRGMGPVNARPITKNQFQKVWLAPNVERYKAALACRVYKDILPLLINEPRHVELEKAKRESFIAEAEKPTGEQLFNARLSEINTTENNRNFDSPAKKLAEQEAWQSQNKSKSGDKETNRLKWVGSFLKEIRAKIKEKEERRHQWVDPKVLEKVRKEFEQKKEWLRTEETGMPRPKAEEPIKPKVQLATTKPFVPEDETYKIFTANETPDPRAAELGLFDDLERVPSGFRVNIPEDEDIPEMEIKDEAKAESESKIQLGEPREQTADDILREIVAQGNIEVSVGSEIEENSEVSNAPITETDNSINVEDTTVSTSETTVNTLEQNEGKTYITATDVIPQPSVESQTGNDVQQDKEGKSEEAVIESEGKEMEPKESINTGNPKASYAQQNSFEVESEIQITEVQPVKRKRGRPRKNPLPENQGDGVAQEKPKTRRSSRANAEVTTEGEIKEKTKTRRRSSAKSAAETNVEVTTSELKAKATDTESPTQDPISESKAQDPISESKAQDITSEPKVTEMVKPNSDLETQSTTQSTPTTNQSNQMDDQPTQSTRSNEAKAENAPTQKNRNPHKPKSEATSTEWGLTLTIESLREYEKIRSDYPFGFIFVGEDGRAKAFYDDAFKAYDVIHDGSPIVFMPHPLYPEDRNKRVPVFEIDKADVESVMPKFMKYNPQFLYHDLDLKLKNQMENDLKMGR